MNRNVALALALFAGCTAGSDPFEGAMGLSGSCIDGTARDPGPACTAPTIALQLDGKVDEWAGLPMRFGCRECVTGDIDSAQIARTAEGSVAMHFITVGPPRRDGSIVYTATFRRADMMADDAENAHVMVVISPDGPYLMLNGHSFSSTPITYAFTEDGLELRVPNGALPYDGQAMFSTRAYFRKGDEYEPGNSGPISTLTCWDPTDIENECNFM